MLQAHPVSADDIARFLSELFLLDEHGKRVQSSANAALGAIPRASLAVHAIGQGLAHARSSTPKHAVKQVAVESEDVQVDI